MHLLDTDALTHLYAGHPAVSGRAAQLQGELLATTIVSKAEMLRGRVEFLLKAATGLDVHRAQTRLDATETFLGRMAVIGFDDAALARFDELRAVKSYKKLGRADLLIAAIVLTHDATLVTRNLKHFQPIHGLKAVNWVD